MSEEAFGATVAKRRLARRLKDLREDAGYTANQVCDKLNWGRGKVNRFEANTWKRPEMSDIRDLLRIYQLTDEEREELEQTAMLARERQWWREYAGDIFDNEFPGYEFDASSIRVYTPLVVPGLLQTPAYITASFRIGPKLADWRARAKDARIRRQDELFERSEHCPEVVAIITEASLRYRWGTQDERRAQVRYLAAKSREPGIEIRYLRFAGGLHPGMSTMLNLFDFPDTKDPSIAYLENEVRLEEVTEEDQVDAYSMMFERIRDAALEPAATRAELERLAEELE